LFRNNGMERPVRVLIVGDSTFMRLDLEKHLESDPVITVVGKARDELDALAQIPTLKPDVVTLNVEMPRLDGLTALKCIMSKYPTPVIMLSAFNQRDARLTIQALVRGAVDFVSNPTASADIHSVIAELRAKIKIAAGVCADSLVSIPIPCPYILPPAPHVHWPKPHLSRKDGPVIVIGASTGGPRALVQILCGLPADLPAAVVVVQHMLPGFTWMLAQWLDEKSPLTVLEATDGDSLARGVVLLAPGNFYLQIDANRKIALTRDPHVNGVRSAIDTTMLSAATHCDTSVIGVVLTGIGVDGTSGARHIRVAGGKVLVEHESTSVVYSMPRSVIEAGLADHIAPLPDVASTLIELVK